MSTFIHGIGASENIDSSGEIVSIAGLDISSLAVDGVFNWEHKNDQPNQVVGKILKAKKIFSDADAEDEYQLYFWNKCKVPFLYVMGELFDDYSDSAREVAGKFRYDADHKNINERNVMNFSVEGSKISKEQITVTRSIARKITITILACNKAAIAEMIVKDPKNPKKSEVDELFKTESVEIETFTPSPTSNLWNLIKSQDPKKYADKLGIKPFKKDFQSGGGSVNKLGDAQGGGSGPMSAGGLMMGSEKVTKSETEMNKALPAKKDHQRGSQIGLTSSGKQVFSHGMIGNYGDFSSKDHAEAAKHHEIQAREAKNNQSLATHHKQKQILHLQAAKSAARKAKPGSAGPARNDASTNAPTSTKPSSTPSAGSPSNKYTYSSSPHVKKNVASQQINKSLGDVLKKPIKAIVDGFAGAGVAEAGRKMPESKPAESKPKESKAKMEKALTAGSGLSAPSRLSEGEALAAESINGRVKKKSKLLQRAELEYTTWTKREEFESFMKSRMPTLTRAEIQVIGQTMLLHKSLKQEKMLKDFYNPATLKGSEKTKK